MRATTIPAIGRSALLHHLWNRRKHTPTPAACRHTMCASEQTAFGGSDILVTDRPLCIRSAASMGHACACPQMETANKGKSLALTLFC